ARTAQAQFLPLSPTNSWSPTITTGNWSTGTNWVGGTPPTGAASTVLSFGGTAGAITATLDSGEPANFTLNALIFSGPTAVTMTTTAATIRTISFTANGASNPFINLSRSSVTFSTGVGLYFGANTTIGGVMGSAASLRLLNTTNTMAANVTINQFAATAPT